VEGVGNSGGSGHVRNNWFARQERCNGEVGVADGEFCFGTHFVELATDDLDIGEAIGAISEGGFATGEFGEILVVAVVTVQDDVIWVHVEEGVLGGGVFGSGRIIEAGWNEVSERGDMDW